MSIVDKYRDFAQHSRELFLNEQGRLARVDQKASWHLSSVTFLLGVAGFFAKGSLDTVISKGSLPNWVVLALSILLVLLLAGAWLSFFLVLKVSAFQTLGLSKKMLRFVRKEREVQIHYAIAARCEEAFQSTLAATKKKTRRLTVGYVISLVAIVVLVVLSVTYAWTRLA